MSLLLKALKQAEHTRASQTGVDKPSSLDAAGLGLEPMQSPASKPRREWVEPPIQETEGSSRLADWSWPLGLVPTTALLALLIALAYGVYFYFMTRPQAWPAPPSPPVTMSVEKQAEANPADSLAADLPMPADQVNDVLPQPAGTRARPQRPAVPMPLALESTQNSTRPQRPAPPARTPAPAENLSMLPATPALRSGLIEQAYAAYQAGRLDEAQALYQQRASQGPSVDALLGLAAIAQAKGQTSEAVRLYQAVLDIAPRNAVAQAALLDTLGTTDVSAAESRIKQMIAREPDAHLFYALGNLHAEQGRWADAQQAYFDAYRSEPGNADYAFNLAVSLDHLRQSDAAVRYYETALKLAGPAARFDRTQAQKRLALLK